MQVIEKQVSLRRGTRLPQELRIYGSAISADWLVLSDNTNVLDKTVHDAGWHFFRLTEEVKSWALAMSKEAACRNRSP